MADILIRGMDIPKDGRKHTALLQFLEDGKCRGIVEYSKSYDDRSVKVFEVVPLPEGHGGLCDRDALIKELQNLFDKREKDAAFSGNRGPSVTWNDAICSIFAAPIIVPAEGGTDDGN